MSSVAADEARFKRRLTELSEQSRYTNHYIFTDFLSPLEASFAYETVDGRNLQVWGGYDTAERVMARFGNPEEFGYEEEFPIRILKISPWDARFAEGLGHRDFLGALVHLGIDRSVLGDILVDEAATAYVFVADRMREFVMEQLVRVRHTQVVCEEVAALPEGLGTRTQERSLVVSSARLDGIISKLFGLSRSEAKAVFGRQEVFRNGRLCTNPSAVLEEGDIVSVRHKGRFIFRGVSGKTRKGNETVDVEVFG